MTTVTLIRGASTVGKYALTLNVTPPLSVAYVAGTLAAARHDVRVVDAEGEAIGGTHPGYRPDVLVNGLSVPEIVRRVDPRSGQPDYTAVVRIETR